MMNAVEAELYDTIAEEYQIIAMLGSGGFGSVYKARERSSGTIVALKSVKPSRSTGEIDDNARNEITALQALAACKNVCHLLREPIESRTGLYLFLQYYEFDLLRMTSHSRLLPNQVKCYSHALLSGLAFMHSRGYLHRDLKPSNIFVNRRHSVAIGDFGCARRVEHGRPLTNMVGTLWYRAPELLLGSEHYNGAVDIWAVGCIIAEMIQGYAIFKGNTEAQQLATILQKKGHPHIAPDDGWPDWDNQPMVLVFRAVRIPTRASTHALLDTLPGATRELKDMLFGMLRWNPARRITAQQALEMPYFNGWEEDYRKLKKKKISMTEKRQDCKKERGRYRQMHDQLSPEQLFSAPPPIDLCA
jgi:serine/threonine protein kinase